MYKQERDSLLATRGLELKCLNNLTLVDPSVCANQLIRKAEHSSEASRETKPVPKKARLSRLSQLKEEAFDSFSVPKYRR